MNVIANTENDDGRIWSDEYCYVDTALGDVNRRNDIQRLDDLSLPSRARDCFHTHLRFPEALRAHAATHLNASGRPSVTGYTGSAWAEFIPFDFDDATDPQRAIQDAAATVTRWESQWGIDPGSLRIYFSGCKGVSIEMPAALFGGFEPCPDVAQRIKRIATTLAEGCTTFDGSIYDTMRLWRIPNTIHGKSGLYKIPLTARELVAADLQHIHTLARSPRSLDLPDRSDWNSIAELEALWRQATPLDAASKTVKRSQPPCPGNAAAPVTVENGPPAALEPIVEDCGWLRHCRADAASLKEPEWYAMLSIVARCEDGHEIAHQWSAPHPKYSATATDEKIAHALTSAGPQTCDQIASIGGKPWCDTCPVRGTIKSPIVLGRQRIAAVTDDDDTYPTIEVGNRQLRDVVNDAWAALARHTDPPVVFLRDRQLIRLRPGGKHTAMDPIDHNMMRHVLSDVASWKNAGTSKSANIFPPKDVAADMVSSPPADLPRLDTVLTSPTFGRTGELLATAGYHRADRVWLDASTDLGDLAVPEAPSSDDVACARALLLDDLLTDFSFATPADAAHAVCLLLAPLVRRLIDGPTPLHLIESPSYGSGKTILFQLAALIATGLPGKSTTLPQPDEEVRKKITSILVDPPALQLFDNVNHALDSPHLASLLTATRSTDRILGSTQILDLPNPTVWAITTTNPTVSTELARRIVRIRLTPAIAQPWTRTNWRHPDILAWARRSRRDLFEACAILVRAWIAAGRPAAPLTTMNSFGEWAGVMGGILQQAGIPGFLENRSAVCATADSDAAEWIPFCRAWWDDFGPADTTAAQLAALAKQNELLAETLTDIYDDRKRAIRVGFALKARRDRIFDNLAIRINDNDPTHKTYRLEEVPSRIDPSTSVPSLPVAMPPPTSLDYWKRHDADIRARVRSAMLH